MTKTSVSHSLGFIQWHSQGFIRRHKIRTNETGIYKIRMIQNHDGFCTTFDAPRPRFFFPLCSQLCDSPFIFRQVFYHSDFFKFPIFCPDFWPPDLKTFANYIMSYENIHINAICFFSGIIDAFDMIFFMSFKLLLLHLDRWTESMKCLHDPYWRMQKVN